MTKGVKIGIGIVTGLLLAGGTIYLLQSKKAATLADAKKYLLSGAIQTDAAFLDSNEDGFIITWAKAAQRDDFFFTFNGQQFNVATGGIIST